jgi:hypothetical protein
VGAAFFEFEIVSRNDAVAGPDESLGDAVEKCISMGKTLSQNISGGCGITSQLHGKFASSPSYTWAISYDKHSISDRRASCCDAAHRPCLWPARLRKALSDDAILRRTGQTCPSTHNLFTWRHEQTLP